MDGGPFIIYVFTYVHIVFVWYGCPKEKVAPHIVMGYPHKFKVAAQHTHSLAHTPLRHRVMHFEMASRVSSKFLWLMVLQSCRQAIASRYKINFKYYIK